MLVPQDVGDVRPDVDTHSTVPIFASLRVDVNGQYDSLDLGALAWLDECMTTAHITELVEATTERVFGDHGPFGFTEAIIEDAAYEACGEDPDDYTVSEVIREATTQLRFLAEEYHIA